MSKCQSLSIYHASFAVHGLQYGLIVCAYLARVDLLTAEGIVVGSHRNGGLCGLIMCYRLSLAMTLNFRGASAAYLWA
jgi:hypothetical protein